MGRAQAGHAAFHQDAGRILDIDLQVAPMPSDAIHALGQAEEGIEIVKFVNLRKHDTAPQIGAGRIHLAVVFIAMPVGEILADSGADGQQVAKDAALHSLGQPAQAGMKAQLIADHGNAPGIRGRTDEFFRAVEGIAQRFFNEDIASCADTGSCDRDVQTAGIAHKSDIRLFRQRLIKAGIDANGILVLHVPVGVGIHGGRYHVRLSPYAISDDFGGTAEQGPEIARVALADAAEADHKNFHCLTP